MGDCKREKGFLTLEWNLGLKDQTTKGKPFDEAGKLVYQKAFAKGLGMDFRKVILLKNVPPLIMDKEIADMGLRYYRRVYHRSWKKKFVTGMKKI